MHAVLPQTSNQEAVKTEGYPRSHEGQDACEPQQADGTHVFYGKEGQVYTYIILRGGTINPITPW
jgi:hypothetical protein